LVVFFGGGVVLVLRVNHFVLILIINSMMQVLVAWILDQAPLGHKAPLENQTRRRWCPLCPGVELSSRHVFFDCEAVATVRQGNGVAKFIVASKARGFGSDFTMTAFLYGMDCDSKAIPVKEHYKRGADLLALQNSWLSATA
jgi:hypothetical protein